MFCGFLCMNLLPLSLSLFIHFKILFYIIINGVFLIFLLRCLFMEINWFLYSDVVSCNFTEIVCSNSIVYVCTYVFVCMESLGISIQGTWRRQWQPTSVFLLESPRDGGAWWAAVSGLYRVRHDWSNLAAAAAAYIGLCSLQTEIILLLPLQFAWFFFFLTQLL